MPTTITAIKALATHLDIQENQITQTNNNTFNVGTSIYTVYPEDEADAVYEQAFLDFVYWQNVGDPAEPEIDDSFDENNHAHFLAPNDYRVHQQDKYYIYRIG